MNDKLLSVMILPVRVYSLQQIVDKLGLYKEAGLRCMGGPSHDQ